MDTKKIKALAFDVFGTVVDWRSSIIREGMELSRNKDGGDIDWAAFADDWRKGYQPAMAAVRSGERSWENIDTLHRRILDSLLEKYSIRGLSEAEIDDFNRAWHRLDPWPDSIPGLILLKRRYVLATMSNGNVALLVDMAKHSGLPWDVVLTPELMRTYKKNSASYLYAISLLGLRPDQTMMVAAHAGELQTVAGMGMRTAYVPRPTEFGHYDPRVLTPNVPVDVACTDLENLAELLGT